MRKVSVIIPVVRPEKAERCAVAVKCSAGIPQDCFEIILVEDSQRIGCPKMVARLTEMARHDLVCFLGDDTVPQADFLKHALDAMETLPDGWGMVGLNDSHHDGNELCTHWMADKRLLPLLDGEFFHTGYYHTHCDMELLDRCRDLGRYVWAANARIIHDHPAITGADVDDDYRRAYNHEHFAHDRGLYDRRKIARHGFKLGIGLPLTSERVHKAFFSSYATMDTSRASVLMLPRFPAHIDDVRNDLVSQAIENGCSHLLMMDTDQIYPPDTIEKLLRHDADVVGVRVHRRYPPFEPIMLRGEIGRHQHIPESEMFSGRLVDVDATGAGCLMIKTTCLLEIGYPWFELTNGKNGKPIGEDINFCSKVRAAGYRIAVDTSIAVGHLTTFVVDRNAYDVYKKIGTKNLIKESDHG